MSLNPIFCVLVSFLAGSSQLLLLILIDFDPNWFDYIRLQTSFQILPMATSKCPTTTKALATTTTRVSESSY